MERKKNSIACVCTDRDFQTGRALEGKEPPVGLGLGFGFVVVFYFYFFFVFAFFCPQ